MAFGGRRVTALFLERQLRGAGIPVISVSIGREDDKQTWRITFDPAATPLQQSNADAIVAAFTAPTASDLADEVAARETQRKELKAVALGLWECIPNPTMTKAQLVSRIKEIYKGL